MSRLFKIGSLAVMFAFGSTLRAQDGYDAPKLVTGVGDGAAALQADGPPDLQDTRPLAGAQNLSLGSRSSNRGFLLPSFGVTTQAQFNPYGSGAANNSSPLSTTFLSGRLALNKISTGSELLVDYLAGGGFSSASTQSSSVIQSLDFSETIRGGRWQQMFGEQFSYLPTSSFNFSGLGGLSNFGVSLGGVGSTPSLRPNLVPNQSIFTNGAERISNAAIVQTTYALGYRSSLNFLGTYGTLHFLQSGFYDSSMINAGAGYNYLLSPLNSMAISYGFSRLMLSALAVGPESHSVQLSLARRITGRLSFQAGAGPDFQFYNRPLGGTNMIVSWTANSALAYQLRNWGTGFSYDHSLTAGSGVLPGAETDVFSGHLERRFGNWEASMTMGYSRNRAPRQTSTPAITPQGWYAGVQASRRFARFGSLFVSYNVLGQSSLATVCLLPACSPNRVTQTVSLGYNWGLRPIILE
jgi:hypothetical protein